MPDLNSTEKVIKILEAFLPDNKPKGNLELSEALGIHRASVNRILGILKQHGFVEQEKNTRLYKLGRTMVELGGMARRSQIVKIRNAAEPFLKELSKEARESVGLVMLAEDEVLVPFRLRGPQPVSVSFDHGDRGVINANAGAKAILAFLPEDELKQIMATHPRLPQFTSSTITSWDKMLEQFGEIRESRIAYDMEEYNLEVCAVGTPVLDSANHALCAVTILTPAHRSSNLSDPKLLKLLKRTAGSIAAELAREPENRN